ncbi:unnamed protein product, partial [Ectocarpus fasciculatus]
MLAQKRVSKDYKDFVRDPIPGCHVRIREDNVFVWDAVIQWPLADDLVVPFHMVIQFPQTYPTDAPKVGFSCHEFGYQNGATMTDSDKESPLYGKLSICLDILGNFGFVHTEWATSKGSGWSPAYSVSSLLMNLQVVLSECAVNLQGGSQLGKRRTIANVCQRHMSKIDVAELTMETVSAQECMGRCAALSDQLGALLCWNRAPRAMIDACEEAFATIGWSLSQRACVTPTLMSASNLVSMMVTLRGSLCNTELVPEALPVATVDPDMVCWFSLEHYNQAILGIGIQRVVNGMHTNISTDGALISLDAFNSGLRQTPMKEAFEWFLPAFLCPMHSVSGPRTSAWKAEIVSRVTEIGRALQPGGTFEDYVLRLYPDLMNTLIVQMMQPQSDVRASERIFRVLIDIWRSFLWLSDEFPSVKRKAISSLSSFAKNPQSRNKKAAPNIGCLLAMRTIVADEDVSTLSFANAYVDESFLRNVMWWQKDRVAATPEAVFPATRVSRHLYLFQTIFCYDVIGTTEADIRSTAALADMTECKLRDQCDNMLAKWKLLLKKEK